MTQVASRASVELAECVKQVASWTRRARFGEQVNCHEMASLVDTHFGQHPEPGLREAAEAAASFLHGLHRLDDMYGFEYARHLCQQYGIPEFSKEDFAGRLDLVEVIASTVSEWRLDVPATGREMASGIHAHFQEVWWNEVSRTERARLFATVLDVAVVVWEWRNDVPMTGFECAQGIREHFGYSPHEPQAELLA